MDQSGRSEARVGILLAEFGALRNQIQQLSTANQATVALQLTTTGAIAGLVLAQNADTRLLLLIPAISSALALVYADLIHRVRITARYINEHLRPLATEYGEDDRLLRWEEYNGSHRAEMSVFGSVTLSAVVIFPGTSMGALIAVLPSLHKGWEWMAWFGALSLLLLQAGVWLFHFSTSIWRKMPRTYGRIFPLLRHGRRNP